METHQGNRKEVSQALGISERNTYGLIKKLSADRFPTAAAKEI